MEDDDASEEEEGPSAAAEQYGLVIKRESIGSALI